MRVGSEPLSGRLQKRVQVDGRSSPRGKGSCFEHISSGPRPVGQAEALYRLLHELEGRVELFEQGPAMRVRAARAVFEKEEGEPQTPRESSRKWRRVGAELQGDRAVR